MMLDGKGLSDSLGGDGAGLNLSGDLGADMWNTSVLEELNDAMFLRLAPAIAVFIGLMVVGVVGNIFVCYIFMKKLRKTTQNFLLLCLGFFDLVSTVVGIPSEIWDMRHYYLYDSSPWACKSMRFLTTLPSFASIMVLMVIAVDRYRKVCKPLHGQIHITYAKIAIIAIVIVSVIFSVPALYIYGHRTFQTPLAGVYGHDCSVDDYFRDKSYPLIYEAILASLFVLFTAALVSLYIRIWMETRRHRKYMKTHAIMGTVLMDDNMYTSSTNYDSSTDNIAESTPSLTSKRSSVPSIHTKGYFKRHRKGRYRSRSCETDSRRGVRELARAAVANVTTEYNRGDAVTPSSQERCSWVVGTREATEIPESRSSPEDHAVRSNGHACVNKDDNTTKPEKQSPKDPGLIIQLDNIYKSEPQELGNGKCEERHSITSPSVKDAWRENNHASEFGEIKLATIQEGILLDNVSSEAKSSISEDNFERSRGCDTRASENQLGGNEPSSGSVGASGEGCHLNHQDVALGDTSRNSSCDIQNGTSPELQSGRDVQCSDRTHVDDGNSCVSHSEAVKGASQDGPRQNEKRSQDGLRSNRVSFVGDLPQSIESDADDVLDQSQTVLQSNAIADLILLSKLPENRFRANGSVESFGSIPAESLAPLKSGHFHKQLKHSKSSQSLTAKRVKKALKATRTTVIASVITLGFILSYLPHLILVILRSVHVDFEHRLDEFSLILYNIFIRSYFVNNVINIFVYGSMNLEFRKQIVAVWTLVRSPRGKPEPPDNALRRSTVGSLNPGNLRQEDRRVDDTAGSDIPEAPKDEMCERTFYFKESQC